MIEPNVFRNTHFCNNDCERKQVKLALVTGFVDQGDKWVMETNKQERNMRKWGKMSIKTKPKLIVTVTHLFTLEFCAMHLNLPLEYYNNLNQTLLSGSQMAAFLSGNTLTVLSWHKCIGVMTLNNTKKTFFMLLGVGSISTNGLSFILSLLLFFTFLFLVTGSFLNPLQRR